MSTKLRRLQSWLGQMDRHVRKAVDETLSDELLHVLHDLIDAMQQRLKERLEATLAAAEERLDRRVRGILYPQQGEGELIAPSHLYSES
ncbi:hypothetical protein R5R35_013038 [Gryllus longicercus]|uniref:Uncharacterized protein n=1 Tax=Gryllus longicercus TaxID=2509291 RepID=A0AAN9Z2J4_9ORTH